VTIDSAQKAFISCSGELKSSARAKRAASNCDLLIAADGGTKHFVSLGLQPRIIIGNMDFNTTDIWNGEKSIVRIPYSPNKDKSDVEFAIEYALKQGCQEILLIGAVSGRLDYTLGNIASTLVAVDRSEKCILHGQVGTPVSLIPYGSGPFTVRTKGLKYSLGDKSLHSATHGLSNELSLTEACVCVSNGILLVYIGNEDAFFKKQQKFSDLSQGIS
jgi:thiamine pyrophosphokinase